MLVALGVLGLASCRTSPEPRPAPSGCVRLPIPSFPLGANVVDLLDNQDADPANDGARGYGSQAFADTLDRLRGLGLDGVVLPVPLWAESQQDGEIRPGHLLQGRGAGRLARAIEQAHARDLFVVLAPHLLLDDGAWRGGMQPRDLERFFATFSGALGTLATLGEAHCAEVLSAAVELKSLSRDPQADAGFRALVEGLRQRFHGELVYSANWDELETMRHWALFDRIAVNAFYPLATEPGASDDELDAGARAVHEALLRFQNELKRQGVDKPLWFLELGFKAVPETHLRPWEWPSEVAAETLPFDGEAQARALRSHQRALHAVPAVDGVFFWAVPADLEDPAHEYPFEPPQGFGFLGKPAEAVIRELAADRPHRSALPEGD